MQLLSQSVAATTIVGPILDSTGAAYTGAVIGDLNITKNGTTAAMAAAATLTHDHNGMYILVFTTGNTDTLGRADISCNKATYAMPPKSFEVVTTAVFNTLVTNGTLASSTSGRTIVVDAAGLVDANTVKVGPTGAGTAQTARDIGASVLLSTGTGTGQLDFTLGVVKANTTQLAGQTVTAAAGVTFPSSVASPTNITAGTITTVTTVTNQLTAAAIATGIWQDATAGDFTTASSIGKALYTGNFAPGAASGLAIVGSAMTLAASQHVIVDSGTVTTVTNQLTAAQIATGIWQDTTAGDFTTALSVGKSLMNGVTLGTGLTVARCTLTDTLTTYTGNTVQTGDSYARIGAAGVSLTAVGLASSQTFNNTGTWTGNVVGTVSTVTTLTNLPAITANWLTATGIAADAITAAKIADNAIDRATFAADTGLQNIRSNTATGGGGTSITLDASASAVNDFYKNALIYLVSGTGAGQGRFCTAYNGGTKVATVGAWATNPDNTSVFAIIPFDSIPGATAPTAAAVATAVWTDLLSGSDFSTAASIGKLLKDDIDATISSRMATYTQPTGFLAATFPLIVASTTNITAATGIDVTKLGGVAQSLADLKDFADAGYDPATHEVEAVKLVDVLGGNAISSGTINDETFSSNMFADDWLTANGVSAGAVAKIWATALTEAYRTDGATGTGAQLLYEILQNLTEFGIAGVTKTVKKIDGSTTAATYTLDSAVSPTAITRAT